MGENFLLKWNDHSTSILSATSLLFQSSGLTDVTIGTSDRSFRAHKLVLSICSSSFAQLFGVNGALASQQNPYIYMQDVPSKHLETLLRYMYEGEVSVEEGDLAPLLTSARGLGIKGLCEVDNKPDNKAQQPNLKQQQQHQQLHHQQQSPESSQQLQQNQPQQVRKKKRKITDNNNFVVTPQISSSLTNGGELSISNVVSVPLAIEVEPVTVTEDVIEVDSSKFETGLEENIVEDEDDVMEDERGLEDLPEDWLSGGQEDGEVLGSDGGGKQQLTCSFCPKHFNSNWHLKRHVMTHTREARFTCDVCHKDFSRNDNLKSHMKTIHGVILPSVKTKSSK